MWLLKFIIKLAFRMATRSLGLAFAVALGPGSLLMMYLFEPHRPLPEMIRNLPSETSDALIAIQSRIDASIGLYEVEAEMVQRLEAQGFRVDAAKNNATFMRRQFDCIETYSIVWTQVGSRVNRTAGLVEKSCNGF